MTSCTTRHDQEPNLFRFDVHYARPHRLYLRMGFARGGERTLPDDLNQTREYYFERPV